MKKIILFITSVFEKICNIFKNKEEKQEIKVEINNNNPISEIVEINNNNIINDWDLQNKYEKGYNNYLERVTKYKNNNKYNRKIVNFWKNGKLIINNVEYSINSLYLFYLKNDNYFDIKLIKLKNGYLDIFNNENYDLKNYKFIRFGDTTSFANFCNLFEINDNIALVNDIESLKKIIHEWDGYINNLTPYCEAFNNKKVIN